MPRNESTVTMTLEDYNEMYRRLIELENAVVVHNCWDNSIEVRFLLKGFKRVIEEKLDREFPDAVLREYAYQSETSSLIAELPKEEVEGEV